MPNDNPYQEAIEQAIQELPPDKHIYFNAFACAIRAGEFIVVLQEDNQPMAILRMTHTVGKSLAQILSDFVSQIEQRTGHPVLNLGEFQNAMTKPNEESHDTDAN